MSFDIVIFAVVAAVLISRLRSVLGTRHGDERQRQNPFENMRKQEEERGKMPIDHDGEAPLPYQSAEKKRAEQAAAAAIAAHTLIVPDELLKVEGEAAEAVRQNIKEIAGADHSFDLTSFIQGARMAFEMITESFAKGDADTLKPLLSEDLYEGFVGAIADREEKGYTSEYILHRIKDARIVEARLGGVMAYVTVDFDIDQTNSLKDKKGKVIEGDPDKINEIHDIWTFARDVRSADPNWELVATQLGDG